MPSYRTHGSCSREILFKVSDDNILTELTFIGGCSGNLRAISKLATGKHIDEIIAILQGIICKNKTSCPDQLAQALIEYKQKKELELNPIEPQQKIKK